MKLVNVMIAAAVLGLGPVMHGATPMSYEFTYQGLLRQGGLPASGTFHLRFQLWDAPSGGAQVGGDVDEPAVAVQDGIFTANLDFGASPFAGAARWLQVQVITNGGNTVVTLEPRQPVNAAPYALFARNADGAGITNLSAASISSGTLASARLPGSGAWALSGTLDVDGGTLAVDATNNRVGIGTSSPTGRFEVRSGLNSYWRIDELNGDLHTNGGSDGLGGIYNDSTNPAARMEIVMNGVPRLAVQTGGNVGIGTTAPARPLHIINPSAFAARFQSSSATASVIEFTSTSSNSTWEYGVAGSTPPFPGLELPYAVLPGSTYLYKQGQTRPALMVDPGGTLRALSLNARSLDASGSASNTNAIAIYGRGNTHGVYGATTGNGGAYGVFGVASNATAWAVYADGRFAASGTKSFRIDHPADPTNKHLSHYCPESPEVINFYSGTVMLDAQGQAEVALPSYFASINTDPRYFLTAIGAAMPNLHVAREIDGAALAAGAEAEPGAAIAACSFRIAGGAPGAKVSWEVKAVRNDRFVRQHGAPVETDKEGYEKGVYQRPELYGQPPEMGVQHRIERLREQPLEPS